MSEFVTDTHALVWHLTSTPRLGADALQVFEATDAGNARVYIPAIVLVELVYLAERARVPQDLLQKTLALLGVPHGSYALAPLDLTVVQAVTTVPRSLVPELPDRIVTATAVALGLPLLTTDLAIRASNLVQVVW
jgi:PIN domain nuclease of toxin-antitoxin system